MKIDYANMKCFQLANAQAQIKMIKLNNNSFSLKEQDLLITIIQ